MSQAERSRLYRDRRDSGQIVIRNTVVDAEAFLGALRMAGLLADADMANPDLLAAASAKAMADWSKRIFSERVASMDDRRV